MANDPNLQAELESMITKTRNTKGTLASAKTWIEGSQARLQAAVQASEDLGATVEELVPVQAELDATEAVAAEVASAIASNP